MTNTCSPLFNCIMLQTDSDLIFSYELAVYKRKITDWSHTIEKAHLTDVSIILAYFKCKLRWVKTFLVYWRHHSLAKRMTEITPIPLFNSFEQMGNVSSRWTHWTCCSTSMHKASQLTTRTSAAPPPHGVAVQDFFSTLTEAGISYDEAINSLEAYFTL